MQIGWGVVCSLFSLVNSYSSLITIRFFLGVAEAGLFPGIVYWSESNHKNVILSSSNESFNHSRFMVPTPNAGPALCSAVQCCPGMSYYFRLVQRIDVLNK